MAASERSRVETERQLAAAAERYRELVASMQLGGRSAGRAARSRNGRPRAAVERAGGLRCCGA
jgi:hypothetical protein